MPHDLGLVELGQGGRPRTALIGRQPIEGVLGRVRDLAAAATRLRALEEGRLEARTGDAHQPSSAARAAANRAISSVVVSSVVQTSRPSRRRRVVRLGVGQRQAGEDAALQQAAMDRAGVRDVDRELVEVGAGMEPAHADRGQRRLELRGTRGTVRRHVAQPVRADGREVDRRREGEQGLVGADVAGRLVATDVLLARPERHDEGALAVEVGGHAHEAAGDLADERVGRGQDAQVRAAVLRRDPERLALAGGDVRPVGARRGEDGQRHRLDDCDEEGARGMGELADTGHGFEQAQEVRVRGDDAGDRPVRVGEEPLERREVRRAGVVSLGDEWDLLELQPAREVGREGLAVVRMDAAADEDPLAAGRPAGHEGRLGRGGSAVVVRGRDDVEVDELGEQGLVLVDGLQRPLAHLGLVRGIGRVPLAAQEELVDRGRTPMAVDPGAQEARQVGPVAPGEALQPRGELQLGLGVGQVER